MIQKSCAILFLVFANSILASVAPVEELWYTEVEPLLDRYCLKCHGGVRQKSGLDLRSLDTILRGGDHGPAIIPGRPKESRLIQYLLPDADPHMPPEGKKQLPQPEIDLLQSWIGKLPRSRSPLASTSSTNIVWVPEYLLELRRSEQRTLKPPKNLASNELVDWFLKSDWREKKIKPAKLADDQTFVRRVSLDILGRIPTLDELERFTKDSQSKKRELLLAKLLESNEYPRHMREVFDVILLGRPKRRNEEGRRDNGWHFFLEASFRENRPWNEIVRDIILARSTNAPERGASWFLYEKKNNHQAMAEAIAPIVFGAQIQCAQCHNHPLAWEIEQRHYWGLVAAFNRSKGIETTAGIGMAESATGGFVQFANLKKESQPAVLAFLNGKFVPEKRPSDNEKESDSPDLYILPPAKEGQKPAVAPVPKFSRRAALADSVTQDNPLLARAFVNRVWCLLMGQGIVHPVDQIDSRHLPSHPELLDWLAHDFETHGYDTKRLIRTIALSRAYQLDSKIEAGAPPPPSSFARAVEKPLSAEQLLNSVLVATGNKTDGGGKVAGHDLNELQQLFVKRFPDLLPAVYNPSLEQALFFSNSPIFDDLLKPHLENTAATMLALPSAEARIDRAFRVVLGRAPDRTEAEKFKNFQMADSAESGIKNLLWTLIASAEFQMNH